MDATNAFFLFLLVIVALFGAMTLFFESKRQKDVKPSCPPHAYAYDTNQKLYCTQCKKTVSQISQSD